MMTLVRLTPLLALGALLASSCAAPWSVSTPDSMIQLEERRTGHFAYRAASSDGVVLAARVEPMGDGRSTPSATLAFWEEALTRLLREEQGYALLEAEDTSDADGLPGRLLRFGLDRDGTSHRYEVTILVARRHLHLLEAGGPTAAFEQHREAIDRARASYRARR